MNKFRNWLVKKLRRWAYLLQQLAWKFEYWNVIPNASKEIIKLAKQTLDCKQYACWKNYSLTYPNIHPSHFAGDFVDPWR